MNCCCLKDLTWQMLFMYYIIKEKRNHSSFSSKNTIKTLNNVKPADLKPCDSICSTSILIEGHWTDLRFSGWRWSGPRRAECLLILVFPQDDLFVHSARDDGAALLVHPHTRHCSCVKHRRDRQDHMKLCYKLWILQSATHVKATPHNAL